MNRKSFLKKSLQFLAATPLGIACGKENIEASTELALNGSSNGSSPDNCNRTNSETAGPFPNKNSSDLVYQNIQLDRKGINLEVQISIKQASTSCGVLEGARVDIWHCDADGNYSQYGSYSNKNFLRGRQLTDKNGLAVFKTIFPGWYSGRAVHIHAQVFDNAGKSLLITQIAFPAELCNKVYQEATNFYTKGLADTSNERDNVFKDGYANELATFSGSIQEGFTLQHTIVV